MALTDIAVVNKALGIIGGAGDQINGEAFLTNLDGTDKVTIWVNSTYSIIRQKVISDLAVERCPFRETLQYADLGPQVDSTILPEIGNWQYAFFLPEDYLQIVAQIQKYADVNYCRQSQYCGQTYWKEYPFDVLLNADGDGLLFVTNTLSNAAGDSAYIQYAIDQPNPVLFSPALLECFVTLLAAELCPVIGKDMRTSASLYGEYKNVSIKDAMRFNASQFNIGVKQVPDYLGGRG